MLLLYSKPTHTRMYRTTPRKLFSSAYK